MAIVCRMGGGPHGRAAWLLICDANAAPSRAGWPVRCRFTANAAECKAMAMPSPQKDGMTASWSPARWRRRDGAARWTKP